MFFNCGIVQFSVEEFLSFVQLITILSDSACLSLPPIHSCYPQWFTIAPFELPAKPQIELLLTGVQLDE
ncbi:uncharacterized [Tachysurus ichikawai]